MAASKTTEARWRSVVREQESSGESVQAFARRHGLSSATLYWWRSHLRRRSARRAERLQLAPVTILPSKASTRASATAAFELELVNGRRLRVPADFDAGGLQRLLATLESEC